MNQDDQKRYVLKAGLSNIFREAAVRSDTIIRNACSLVKAGEFNEEECLKEITALFDELNRKAKLLMLIKEVTKSA